MKPDIEAVLTKADPKLARVIAAVIAKNGIQRIEARRATPFQALVRAVVYQSVSTKAAAAIFKRLEDKVGRPMTSAKVAALSPEELKSAGLSNAKVRSIHGLAEWFATHRAVVRKLKTLSDAELIAALTTIPGIGIWTVNIFLIFTLGRPDIVPHNDLGIRRGFQYAYGLKDLATPAQVYDRAQKWTPHRSIASLYLWKAARLDFTEIEL